MQGENASWNDKKMQHCQYVCQYLFYFTHQFVERLADYNRLEYFWLYAVDIIVHSFMSAAQHKPIFVKSPSVGDSIPLQYLTKHVSTMHIQ